MDEELQLTDLIDVNTLQQIQDAFFQLTGFSSITTDANGVAITTSLHFPEFCKTYTRATTLGCVRCEQCDKYGAELALEKGSPCIYPCHMGLLNFVAPIRADDKIVGCFIGGQVLTEPPNITKILSISRELGITDPISYLQSALQISIVKQQDIDKAADFLYTFANILSDIAYNKYLVYHANTEIEKAARMKSDFLANMSHEIRTPMNAVIGMAEMAMRENLPPTARDYISQIKSSGKTLLTIINDILDFSKIESGKMDINAAPYDLLSMVNDISSIIMTRIDNKDVELILDISPDIPNELIGDSIRIKQVIVNLTNNAVKFTNHGQVLLNIDYFSKENGEIELLISVKDTGIGIKKEDVGKLFHSFQQLDSKRNRNIEGTGLGLAISKQLLTLMHGDIWVESEYGKGSNFSFLLPQRVSNPSPIASLKEKNQIFAASMIANPYVRAQLENDIRRLGIDYLELNTPEELSSLAHNVDFLFIEEALYTKQTEDFIIDHPHITAVLIINFNASYSSEIDNLVVVKKPLYSINLAAIFNHEDLHYFDYGHSSDDDFDFIAPDANILIVDDNAINLTVVEGLLEPLLINIDTALSGKEALDKIEEKQYDLIFMDHMMPELDGVETTHLIRRFHKNYEKVPIIALTANAVDGAKSMFLQEGLDDFVAKPMDLKIISSKLKQWLPKQKIQHARKTLQKKQETSPAIEIEGLNVKAAIKLLGSEKLFWAVLKDYYKIIEKKANLIEKYEREEDWHNYTIEVHTLKSSSGQIGASTLSDKASALEKAGNAQDGELIHQYTGELLAQYRSYIRILQPFFPEEESNDADKAEITTDVLRSCFSELQIAFDNLDIDHMEKIISAMNEYRYPDWQHELFTQLKAAVDEIDIDTCKSIVSAWENRL